MNRSFKEEGRKKEKKVLKRRNKKGRTRIKGIINKRSMKSIPNNILPIIEKRKLNQSQLRKAIRRSFDNTKVIIQN